MGATRALCLGAAALLASISVACSAPAADSRTAVGSIYPLAWALQRVAGPDWEVIDLTPPGTEAHDVELSLEDRTAIEEADLVVYVGDIGFQPQVEQAVEEIEGPTLALSDQLIRSPGEQVPVGTDPHLWLDPGTMRTMASLIANELAGLDPSARGEYRTQADQIRSELARLQEEYQRTLDLAECSFQRLVVPHDAFEYMVGRYGFEQFGLAGITPEGEPTAGRLAEAEQLLAEGEAGAVFYEAADDESMRTAQTLAEDSGVPALPLSTLESQPPSGDYISVMEDNLESLREGLGCP